MKVLLLELNEINWRLLDPLIESGKLPTFDYLKQHGAWGSPVSVDLGDQMDPWITWTTVYTGRPQEEHGVFFLEQPPETIRAKRIWELASDAGLTVGVYGSLNSWPPKPVKGFWVPGTFAQEPDTYPRSLEAIQELNLHYTRGYNYGAIRGGDGILWKAKMGARLAALGLKPRSALRVIGQLARERFNSKVAWKRVGLQPIVNFDVFSSLWRQYRPALATFHTNHVAHYQHLYWRAMQPAAFPQAPSADERETYGRAIEHGYVVADEILKRALRLMTPDTLLVVASSMGQQPYINRSLEKGKRLLRLRSFEAFINFLGLGGRVRIVSTMADQFNIYGQSPEDLARILEIVRAAYIDRPSQPLFDACRMANSLTACIQHYNGTGDESLCYFPMAGAMRTVQYGELVESFDHTKSGCHHPVGMLMMYGAGVRRGRIEGELSNLDLAPTLLAHLGVTIPSELRGRIIAESFGRGPVSESTAPTSAGPRETVSVGSEKD